MFVQRMSRFITLKASGFIFSRYFHATATWGLRKDKDDKLDQARQLLPKRFQLFDEQYNEIIYEDAELDVILNTKQQRKKVTPKILHKQNLNLRGKEGVLDIEELVNLLTDEKLVDIVVIKVPKELKYCQFMVITTAISFRQMKAFIEVLRKIYKIKKNADDPYLQLEDKSKDWRLVDLGNIILHVMIKEARDFYDLETLWTVGTEYDEKSQKKDEEASIVRDIISKHVDFLEKQSQSN